MAEKVETANEGISTADPEKAPHHVGEDENWGDQIPHEMLETLAPNGETEYILDKINNMSEEEAVEIVTESLRFHADDWNFPTDMRERMTRLLQGRKLYGEFYDRDLRIDATMMRWSSPYPGVRAVQELEMNDHIPIETFRAYFLGIGWVSKHSKQTFKFVINLPLTGIHRRSLGHLWQPSSTAVSLPSPLAGLSSKSCSSPVQRFLSMPCRIGASQSSGRVTHSTPVPGPSKNKCSAQLLIISQSTPQTVIP